MSGEGWPGGAGPNPGAERKCAASGGLRPRQLTFSPQGQFTASSGLRHSGEVEEVPGWPGTSRPNRAELDKNAILCLTFSRLCGNMKNNGGWSLHSSPPPPASPKSLDRTRTTSGIGKGGTRRIAGAPWTTNMNNGAAKPCFAHNHMTATEYAIYDVCRAMSAKHNGIVYFSGPEIAKKFRSMSKNTPYTALSSLVKMKWFELVKPTKKNPATGKNTATHYQVLTHEQWVAKHPNRCPDPDAGWKETLSQLEGMPSQSEGTVRPNLRERPSQLEGTNRYKPISITHTSTDIPPPPYPLIGMDSVPSVLDGATAALAPLPRGGPYPQIGTDVSGTGPLGLRCPNTEQPPAVAKLASLFEEELHIPQYVYDLPHFDRFQKLPESNAETLFRWTMANPDWRMRYSGASALRSFCRDLPTIVRQYNQNRKAESSI